MTHTHNSDAVARLSERTDTIRRAALEDEVERVATTRLRAAGPFTDW